MAAGIYPQEPGSTYGPCLEPCNHLDCAEQRKDAASICRICEKPIGYGTRVYRDHSFINIDLDKSNHYVHADCLEAEIEGRNTYLDIL